MLADLKFVAGAINKKEIVLALAHFRIENKTIKGYNGMMGLCSPIDLDLDVTPNATQLIKAVQTCEDTIALHVTAKGKLSIKSGKFKALVECIEKENFPEINPEGEIVKLSGPFIEPIKKLIPFISDDASRPWSRGVLFDGHSAFATNNIVLVESWLGFNFPLRINVPKTALLELIRINEEPEYLQVTENRITFHFSGQRWLSCQTFSTEWPDLNKVLNVDSNPQIVPEILKSNLEDLIPFLEKDEKVYINDNRISTSYESDSGASYEIDGLPYKCVYNLHYLLDVLKVSDNIDFSTYPAPSLFFGDNIRGAIIGIRMVDNAAKV